MVRFSHPIVFLGLAGLFLSVACNRKEPPTPEEAVATVGDAAISAATLQKHMASRFRQPTPEQKQAVLEELIRMEATYAQAVADGYDRRPEIQDAFKQLVTTRYIEDHLTHLLEKDHVPTLREIQDFYLNNQAAFGDPEKSHVAMIFFKVSPKATEEKKAEARSRAEQILARARETADAQPDFGDLAQQHSDEQVSRYTGGKVGWVDKGATHQRWDPKVIQAIFDLRQPGQVSPVVETSEGHYLLKLIEHRPSTVKPLEQVRERIGYQLQQTRKQQIENEFFARLRATVPVRINHSLVDATEIPNAKPEGPIDPPPMPVR